MKFDDLDAEMRVFETAGDRCVLPDLYMVARIDGRNFTRLTKEVNPFEAPFDVRFRDHMLDTVEHVMQSGFRIVFGYTQSDEISLLFHRSDSSFGRKTRKLNSILAGEASAKFSLLLGQIGAFDCRICELPNAKRVCDYFRWRQEDANRNSLSAHCYWTLRKLGVGVDDATNQMRGMGIPAKKEFLLEKGINFHNLPLWQKRGVGLYWESYAKISTDPRTGEAVEARRRRIKREMELPAGEDYGKWIDAFTVETD